MARKKKPTFVEAHCNKCGPDTRHELLRSATIDGVDAMENPWWYEFEFNQCQGCMRVHLRERFTDDPEGEGRPWLYYPPAATRHRPEWARRLWKKSMAVLRVMEETYQAHHAGLNRVALMGARSLLDMTLTHAVGEQRGGFTAMLAKATSGDIVSKIDAKILAAAFDAGSASAHRGFSPTSEIVSQVIDIVENVMQRVYQCGVRETGAALSRAVTGRLGFV